MPSRMWQPTYCRLPPPQTSLRDVLLAGSLPYGPPTCPVICRASMAMGRPSTPFSVSFRMSCIAGW